MRTVISATALLICALVTGCTSTTIEEEYPPPRLLIAENSDGEVTIGWKSDPGYVYTVYYQSQVDGTWKPLPNATRIRGTGENITVQDRVKPSSPPRPYRILPEKM